MTYTVRLNRDFGNRLQSDKDSSVYNLPSAQCVNISGCPGAPTHVRGGASFTFNITDNCVPAGLGLQASHSGLISKGAVGSLGSTSNVINGVTFSAAVVWLADYVLKAFAPNQAAPNIAALRNRDNILDALRVASDTDRARVVIRLLGSNIIASVNNRTAAQISFPSVYPVFDNCKTQIGWGGKTSMTYFGFNTETCEPTLLWQASIGIAFSADLFQEDYATAAVQAFGGTANAGNPPPIQTQLTSPQMFPILARAQAESDCDLVADYVYAQYREFLNKDLIIGTSAA